MRFFAIILAISILLFSNNSAFTAPATIETTWSHRQIAHVTVNPDIPEGSLFVTFSADQTITPIDSPSGMESINPSTWRLNLTWDNLDPLIIAFINTAAETTLVTADYSPLMPLNPLIHEMPVLNIITAPVNLWDPDWGIHVFGLNENCLQHGEEWERPAVFQLYDGSNSPSITEQIGLRINGGWSRRVDQKGLRFYFDDYGSSDSIEYDFFNGAPSSFQRLLTRTGRWPSKCLNSVFAEGMFMDLGHLGSRSRDVVVYLNNEYFGFLTLRERLDGKFIEHTHELDDDGFNMIKDGSLIEGVGVSWWIFLNSCEEDQDFDSHEWFTYATSNLDLSTYIDWLLINILGATADNGSSANITMLQLGTAPWQVIMYDEDAIFLDDNLNADLFRFLSIATVDEYNQYRPAVVYSGSVENRIKWASPFRGLMQNSEFKILFKNRFEELMSSEFSEQALHNRLMEISANQTPEMVRHLPRWGLGAGEYNAFVNDVAAWLQQRLPIITTQFDSFLESYRVPVELSKFFETDVSDESVRLNWRTESEEDCIGFNLYRGSSPDNMTMIATYETNNDLVASGAIWQMAEYDFQDDISGQNFPLFYQLAKVNSLEAEELLPWVLEIIQLPPPPALRINEFLALNIDGLQDETGTPEDWVEIFNAGDETVNLGGMYLTDNLQATTKWEFPAVSLEPGGFLLVWCDSDPENGPLHTTFKLNASGESIGIFDSFAGGNQLVDAIDFGLQTADISEGRTPDGGSQWTTYQNPTPGYSNTVISTVPSLQPAPFQLGPNHPNPFNPTTTIHFKVDHSAVISIHVYDINGRRIRTLVNSQIFSSGQYQTQWNGCDDHGKSLASGTYFARAITGNEHQVLKLSLIK